MKFGWLWLLLPWQIIFVMEKQRINCKAYFSFVSLRMSLNFFSYMVFLCPVCRVDFYFPDPHKDRRFRTNRFQLSRQPFLIAAVGCPHMHPNKKSGKERHTGASCGQTIIYTTYSRYQILRKKLLVQILKSLSIYTISKRNVQDKISVLDRDLLIKQKRNQSPPRKHFRR